MVAHDAMRALINLSTKPEECQDLIDDELISILVRMIVVRLVQFLR
jgi:hypothetical protein